MTLATPEICVVTHSLRRLAPSGAVAAFLSWQVAAQRRAAHQQQEQQQQLLPAMLTAAYGGSLVLRAAAHAAYSRHGRAMLAGDIIDELAAGAGEVIDAALALAPQPDSLPKD